MSESSDFRFYFDVSNNQIAPKTLNTVRQNTSRRSYLEPECIKMAATFLNAQYKSESYFSITTVVAQTSFL